MQGTFPRIRIVVKGHNGDATDVFGILRSADMRHELGKLPARHVRDSLSLYRDALLKGFGNLRAAIEGQRNRTGRFS